MVMQKRHGVNKEGERNGGRVREVEKTDAAKGRDG